MAALLQSLTDKSNRNKRIQGSNLDFRHLIIKQRSQTLTPHIQFKKNSGVQFKEFPISIHTLSRHKVAATQLKNYGDCAKQAIPSPSQYHNHPFRPTKKANRSLPFYKIKILKFQLLSVAVYRWARTN